MQDTTAARKHVVYEYSMLLFATHVATSLLESLPPDEDSYGSRAHLGSAIRDSALLHARALYYFLICDRKFESDVVATDFLAGAANPDWAGSLPDLAKRIPDINKFRGHISYERSTRDWVQWDIPAIYREVAAAFDEFLGQLPSPERDAWDQELDERLLWADLTSGLSRLGRKPNNPQVPVKPSSTL